MNLLIRDALTAPLRQVRLVAIEGLAVSNASAAVHTLSSLVLDNDPVIRLHAIEAMHMDQVRGAAAMAGLAIVLRSGSSRERMAALKALGRAGRPAAAVAEADIATLLSSADTAVRAEAFNTLADIGVASPETAALILKGLFDSAVYVRRAAALALREILPSATMAVPALKEALRDSDVEVRQTVIGALGSYGAQSRPALEALRREATDEDVREHVACALARIEGDNRPSRYESMDFRSAVPQFKWWPEPSTEKVIGGQLFRGATRLGDVFERLWDALEDLAYEPRVLPVPGGFVVVTRAERFAPDTGRALPEPERWAEQPSHIGFDVQTISQIIFGTNRDFRVFAFLVTNRRVALVPTEKLDRQEFDHWVYARGAVLPGEIGNAEVSGLNCVGMVYHFTGRERDSILTKESSSFDKHLRASGLLKELSEYGAH
jgi:HEAT repeat protein